MAAGQRGTSLESGRAKALLEVQQVVRVHVAFGVRGAVEWDAWMEGVVLNIYQTLKPKW